jgi:hypothetical protein
MPPRSCATSASARSRSSSRRTARRGRSCSRRRLRRAAGDRRPDQAALAGGPAGARRHGAERRRGDRRLPEPRRMTRAVWLTDGAARDLDELYAAAYDRGGSAAADRFLDRIQVSFAHRRRAPSSGSRCRSCNASASTTVGCCATATCDSSTACASPTRSVARSRATGDRCSRCCSAACSTPERGARRGTGSGGGRRRGDAKRSGAPLGGAPVALVEAAGVEPASGAPYGGRLRV